jgi:hypothetical protein
LFFVVILTLSEAEGEEAPHFALVFALVFQPATATSN